MLIVFGVGVCLSDSKTIQTNYCFINNHEIARKKAFH